MANEDLDRYSLLTIFIVYLIICALAIEVGYRIGRWRHSHCLNERDQPVGAMVGSILGLLALVLGFTFNLAASRFDARRQTILDEANAIGTMYLRTRFLPEPHREEIAVLLREYVDVRIRGLDKHQLKSAIRRSEEIHQELWSQAVESLKTSSDSVMTSLFIRSLNDLIDLHGKRIFVGLRSRIPIVIWIGLTALAVLSIAAVGYQAGLSSTQRSPMMIGLILAFVFVMYLIADLDRSSEGLLRVGQESLYDVQRSMRPVDETPDARLQ